jgi:hypothetical protein
MTGREADPVTQDAADAAAHENPTDVGERAHALTIPRRQKLDASARATSNSVSARAPPLNGAYKKTYIF